MRKLLPAALVLAVVAGCGVSPTSKAPVRAASKVAAQQADKFLHISYVTANGMMGTSFEAPPNHYIRLQAYTSAPWNAQLNWTWRSFGSFINGFNDRATWTTPPIEGSFTVDVQVRDKDNGFDWTTLYFQIKKQAAGVKAVTEGDRGSRIDEPAEAPAAT